MPDKKDDTPFQLGDRVKIRHSQWRGRIVELRPHSAPGARTSTASGSTSSSNPLTSERCAEDHSSAPPRHRLDAATQVPG